MTSLKICMLIDTLAMGGAEKVAVTCASELSRQGHCVAMVAYHPFNDFALRLAEAGVQTEIVRGGARCRAPRLRRFLHQGKFEIIHAYKAPCLIWGRCATFGRSEARWFGGHHALSRDKWFVRTLCRSPLVRPSGWIVPSKAAAVIVESNYARAGAKTFVVNNPVDLTAFRRTRTAAEAKLALGIKPRHLIVTMVANLHPWKNYGLFLRAAQLIRKVHPEIIFLSVGRDWQHGAVQSQCQSMGLNENVRFLGHRTDVAAILEATDLAVITSPQESFCLALAEAGAMGIPCVSTDNGGASEIIISGQTGFLVPTNDEHEFSRRVIQLLGDSATRLTMGLAAQRRVTARFAPSQIAGRLVEIYSAGDSMA